jgi:hypothetical protein
MEPVVLQFFVTPFTGFNPGETVCRKAIERDDFKRDVPAGVASS